MNNTMKKAFVLALATAGFVMLANTPGSIAQTTPLPQSIDDRIQSESNTMPAPVTSPANTMRHKRTILYLYNPDYPTYPFIQSPKPPIRETKFWRLMDKEMDSTNHLALTENLEEADYRVEVKCAGIFKCSKLKVFIETPTRDVLSSFTLGKTTPILGSTHASLRERCPPVNRACSGKNPIAGSGRFWLYTIGSSI